MLHSPQILLTTGRPTVASVTYQGPGDIASGAVAWGGFRAYSAAYAASLGGLVDIVDQSGGNFTTLHTTASGKLNMSEYTTFMGLPGVTTAMVKQLYDQTGHSNHWTQATLGLMPALAAAGPNSEIMMVGNFSVGPVLNSPNITIASQPYTIAFVGFFDLSTPGRYAYFGDSTGSIFAGLRGTAFNTSNFSAGTEIATPNTTGWHATGALANGASSFVSLDGVAGSASNAGSTAFPGTTHTMLLNDNVGAAWPTGAGFAEFGIWSGDQSSHFAALNTNAHDATKGWNF